MPYQFNRERGNMLSNYSLKWAFNAFNITLDYLHFKKSLPLPCTSYSQYLNKYYCSFTYRLNHQVSICSSCSSTMLLHSKLLLSHRFSIISTRRISLHKKNNEFIEF